MVLSFKKIIVFSLLILMISGCNDDKKNVVSRKKDETQALIKEFIDNQEERKGKNIDHYATSTYRPSEPLYKPVLFIQINRWDLAKPLLEKLVKKNNPDAMYWLANISGGSAFSGARIASLFKRSAKLGNPYAALRLSPDSYDCSNYLSGYCDKKWKDLALKILHKRAKNGDIKAQYYIYDILDNVNNQDKLENILANADDNNFYPLYKYLIYNDRVGKENRKKLYDIMVSKRYSNVIDLMRYNFSDGLDNFNQSYYTNTLDELKSSIWTPGLKIVFYSELLDRNFSIRNLRELFKAYYSKDIIKNFSNFKISNMIIDNIKYNEELLDFIISEYVESNDIKPFTKKDKYQLKVDTIKELKESKPIIYIDEYHYKP